MACPSIMKGIVSAPSRAFYREVDFSTPLCGLCRGWFCLHRPSLWFAPAHVGSAFPWNGGFRFPTRIPHREDPDFVLASFSELFLQRVLFAPPPSDQPYHCRADDHGFFFFPALRHPTWVQGCACPFSAAIQAPRSPIPNSDNALHHIQ